MNKKIDSLNVDWKKSSRSMANGNCVEVAPTSLMYAGIGSDAMVEAAKAAITRKDEDDA